MGPARAGYFSMESLLTGAITLYHVAMANDHIAVVAENQKRATKKN